MIMEEECVLVIKRYQTNHSGGKDHKLHNLLSNDSLIKIMERRGRKRGAKKKEKKESYTRFLISKNMYVNSICFLCSFLVNNVYTQSCSISNHYYTGTCRFGIKLCFRS